MKHTIIGLVTAITLAVFGFISTASVSAQGQGNATAIEIPIVGSGPGATFTGQLDVTRFVRSGDQVLALGTLTGTLTNTVTGTVRNVVRQVAIPLDLDLSGAVGGVCEILSLVLGPLDLNLLGLVVHLDQVVLDIDAQSGPGNLLGNLLCAVAGLLDSGGPLNQIVSLLNQILGALG